MNNYVISFIIFALLAVGGVFIDRVAKSDTAAIVIALAVAVITTLLFGVHNR